MNKIVISKQAELLQLLKLPELPERAVKVLVALAYQMGLDDGKAQHDQ